MFGVEDISSSVGLWLAAVGWRGKVNLCYTLVAFVTYPKPLSAQV